MEGDLVAQGGHGCDMDFVGSDLQTPKCTTDMWLAIQAVDSEATSLGGHSKGGIKAAMQWCGQDVYTDDTWECSTVAEEGWQNPIADGYDPLMEFDDAVPPYGADLTCRHRELPSCSWVRRNTNVVTGTEQASECAAMGVGPSPLCKEEALLADCASLNSASACSGYVDAQGRYSGPAHVDAEGRGVCRHGGDPAGPAEGGGPERLQNGRAGALRVVDVRHKVHQRRQQLERPLRRLPGPKSPPEAARAAGQETGDRTGPGRTPHRARTR